MEDLNQEGGDEGDINNETSESNQMTGDDSGDSLSDNSLQVYNERAGKNFKSWDKVFESQSNLEKAVAQKTPNREKPTASGQSDINNELLEDRLAEKYPNYSEEDVQYAKWRAGQAGHGLLKELRDNKDLATRVSERVGAGESKNINLNKINTNAGDTITRKHNR